MTAVNFLKALESLDIAAWKADLYNVLQEHFYRTQPLDMAETLSNTKDVREV